MNVSEWRIRGEDSTENTKELYMLDDLVNVYGSKTIGVQHISMYPQYG